MRILMVGSGALTYHVARDAQAQGHRVTLVVEDRIEAEDIARHLDITVVAADGTHPQILRDAEVHAADLVVALTPRDQDNLVICQIARKIYSIKRTVALVNDPDNRQLFERLEVSPVISAAEILGTVIHQASLFEGIVGRLSLRGGRLGITEVRLHEKAPAVGKSLGELDLPEHALVVAILRGEQTLVPRGGAVMAAGDEILLLAQADASDEALRLLLGSER